MRWTRQAVSRDITDPNQTVPVTTYPSGDDLKKVAELIKAGDPSSNKVRTSIARSWIARWTCFTAPSRRTRTTSRTPTPKAIRSSRTSSTRRVATRSSSHDMITEPGSTFLDDVARHEWTDDGKSVRTLTDWVND